MFFSSFSQKAHRFTRSSTALFRKQRDTWPSRTNLLEFVHTDVLSLVHQQSRVSLLPHHHIQVAHPRYLHSTRSHSIDELEEKLGALASSPCFCGASRLLSSDCFQAVSVSSTNMYLKDIPPQERAATLQGTLSHTPDHLLERIASLHGCSVSSLATLSVQEGTGTLYNAVLEYTALCPPPDPKSPNPITVQDYEADKDDSSSDEEGDGRHGMPFSGSSRPEAGIGLRQRRYPIPRFKYALGETVIVWPPPRCISADVLALERDIKKGGTAKKAALKKAAEMKLNLPSTSADNLASELAKGARISEQADANADKGEVKSIHILHYSMGEPYSSDGGGMVTFREILMVTPEKPAVLRKFAREVIQWQQDKDYVESDGSKFSLMRFKTNNCGEGWWQSEGMKRARPPSSVILPEGQIDAILQDIRKFIQPETRRWYLAHGLPQRRSYLFYGPPGTGKTSTIRAIASVFRLSCCFLSMTTANFSNQVLGDALSQIPSNALIVLEDVDALFNEDRKNEQSNNLTFSGLLNALDGLISADGVITIMTTNHIERLDKALIRGGRVDRRFHFQKPTHGQIKDLFKSFYPDVSEDVAKKFLNAVLERPNGEEVRSIATLQQLFIDQRESSAEECIAAIPAFFESHFPSGTRSNKEILYN